MSGAERGFLFPPEIDDEVLVAFEQGDLRFPYVLGFCGTASNCPRTPSRPSTIKTVSSHVLEFEDKEGSEQISLLFKGDKPSLTMKQDTIEIALDGSVSIKWETNKLTIHCGSSTIELSASGVKVTGTRIDLN